MKKEDRKYLLETRLYWARSAAAEYREWAETEPKNVEAKNLLQEAEKKLKKLQRQWDRYYAAA